MESIKYGLTETNYLLCENKRTSYGISVYADSEKEDMAVILMSVNDLSSDKQKLMDLVEKCNRLELSLLHFYDVIEDFLAD